ncbi:ATP-dependent helicase [Rathayibacter sp. VKM Ac-2803]|uniref:ATP-dependent helicase n=1 Tax=Rathayibacter sp. VKM Ac-2803 TaxID=2609256 RepID=UPI00135BC451|nr:ATP-dependent helicase [Rathayibacter sp. VKM Ac-2803]
MTQDRSDFLLTAEQAHAVNSNEGAIVVLAGAGSGKTEIVARRVLRLLESSDGSSRILALTYTNKAAEELRNRFRLRAGSLGELVTTETLHGFAHALVQQHGTRIGLPIDPELLVRDEDRVELLARWLASERLAPSEDALAFLREVDLSRARLQPTENVANWRNALSSLPGLDYPALFDATHELLDLKSVRRQIHRTYSNIIVDEAQNLTPAQYRLLTDLLGQEGEGPAAVLVGDDKQSIVSFAGADPSLLKRFVADHSAKVIRLQENFRSARVLSALSDSVARDLDQRLAPTRTHPAAGALSFQALENEAAEGTFVADWVASLLGEGLPQHSLAPGESPSIKEDEIAILGRSASTLREVALALDGRQIKYAASSSSGDWLEGSVGRLVLEIIALRAAPDQVSTRWRLSRLLAVPEEELVTPQQVRVAIRDQPNEMMASVSRLFEANSIAELLARLSEIEVPRSADVAELAGWEADSAELRAAWLDFTTVTDKIAQTWSNFRRFCSHRQRGAALSGVQLLTIHKAQGREFKAVVIVGMNDGQIPDFRARTAEDAEAELRTFYVAITRARRSLLLTRPRQRRTRYGMRVATPSRFLSYLPTSARSSVEN